MLTIPNLFVEILDDLAEGIDRTTVGLMNETQQVRTIARKDSTCGKRWTYALHCSPLFKEQIMTLICFCFRLLDCDNYSVYCYPCCCICVILQTICSHTFVIKTHSDKGDVLNDVETFRINLHCSEINGFSLFNVFRLNAFECDIFLGFLY